MDIQSQFILNRFKNKNSIDKDFSLESHLKNTTALLNNVDMNTIIDLNSFFNKTRNSSLNYKIYGTINNYGNFLYNKKIEPSSLSDFLKDVNFTYEEDNQINLNYDIYNQFNYYLVYPYKYKFIDSDNNYYQLQYKKLTQLNDIDIVNCGFAKDIYSTNVYNFTFNKDINLENKFTLLERYNVDIPITNLQIYVEPINNDNIYERVYKNFNTYNKDFSGLTIGFNPTTSITLTLLNIIKPSSYTYTEFINFYQDKLIAFFNFYNLSLNENNFQILKEFLIEYLNTSDNRYYDKVLFTKENEIINGDLYFFNEDEYTFSLVQEQYYSIKNKIKDDLININKYSAYTKNIINNKVETQFEFKYRPFYNIDIKKFSNYTESIYISGISNNIIPEYAIQNNTYYLWRDILDVGYIEQDENNTNGVDYPFINQKHYLYNNINIKVLPDLSDRNTITLFNDLISNNKVTKEINELNIGNFIC
jgi:hypothetical protein